MIRYPFFLFLWLASGLSNIWYVFFMTMIGVIIYSGTGVFWWIPGMFVLSLIPAGIIIATVFVGLVWLILF